MEAKEQLENYIKLVDETIENRGRRIIKRNYLLTYKFLQPNKANYWFYITVYSVYNVSLSLVKDSLLARQQVCKDILEIYYPNSFKQLILNLWKRY